MPQTDNSHEHGHGMTSPPSVGRAWGYLEAQNGWRGGESDLRYWAVKSKGMTGIEPHELRHCRSLDRMSNSGWGGRIITHLTIVETKTKAWDPSMMAYCNRFYAPQQDEWVRGKLTGHRCRKPKQDLLDREPSQPAEPLAIICSLPLLQDICLANKSGY